MKVCSFPLMGRNRRIKAKTIGPPHGLPKRLTFRSGSVFFRPFLLKEKDQKFKAASIGPPRGRLNA